MFISSSAYTDAIHQTIANSKSLSVAVAFWGVGSEDLFSSISGKEVRIICNLTSGGTNPEPIKTLRALKEPKIHLKQLDDLHAKVIVGERSAVIGSANFSTNGLCLEGQDCAGTQEAGVQITDPVEIASAQAWFESAWANASDIDDDDIERAQENWKTRSGAHVFLKKGKRGLMSQPDAKLQGLNVYVVVYHDEPSDAATKAHKEALKSAASLRGIQTAEAQELQYERRSLYEGWGRSKRQSLPKEVPLIDVYCHSNGNFEVRDIWVRDEIDGKFFYPGTKEIGIFEGVLRKDKCGSYAFGTNDRKELKRRLQPFIEDLQKGNVHICEKLSKALGLPE